MAPPEIFSCGSDLILEKALRIVWYNSLYLGNCELKMSRLRRGEGGTKKEKGKGML